MAKSIFQHILNPTNSLHIRFSLLLFLFCFSLSSQAATSIPGSVISTDTTWNLAGSPYTIQGNVNVALAATLSIEPGVRIEFVADTALLISGDIIARGNLANPVIFTGSAGVNWGYIRIVSSVQPTVLDANDNYLSGSILEHVEISKAGSLPAVTNNASLQLVGSSILLDNVSITESLDNALSAYDLITRLVVRNSDFTNNQVTTGEIVYISGTSGIETTVQFSANTLSNNLGGAKGVYVYRYINMEADGNSFTSNACAVQFESLMFTPVFSNNTLSNNCVTSLADPVVSLNNVDTVSGNIISNNGTGGLKATCRRGSSANPNACLISNNQINNNSGDAYALEIVSNDYSKDIADIRNNTVTDNKKAVLISSSGRVIDGELKIRSNTISGNLSSGLNLSIPFSTSYSRYCRGNCTVQENNIFDNNPADGKGSALYLEYARNIQIAYNFLAGFSNIIGSSTVYMEDSATNALSTSVPSFSNNTILTSDDGTNLTTYAFYNNLKFNDDPGLQASDNYWGSADTAVVTSLIFDFIDDSTLSVVNATPILTSDPLVDTLSTLAEGAYQTAQTTELLCIGCKAIYYTTDGSTPDSSSTKYDSAININQTMTIKYIPEYSNGLFGAVVTLEFVIDFTSPFLVISNPDNGLLLSSLAIISGTASDEVGGSGINRVEVLITDGSNYFKSDGSIIATESWHSLNSVNNWSLDTSQVNWLDGNYTIKVRAFDNANNVSSLETRSLTIYTGSAAFTQQNLSLSSQTILQNETLNVLGQLFRLPDDGSDLTGLEILLTVTDPNGAPVQYTTATDDAFGHFSFSGVSGFTLKGLYTLQTSYAGNLFFASSTSVSESVLVGSAAGYAIIVQGKLPNNEGLDSHNKTANRAYQTLKDRGFLDANIYYFNFDNTQAGVDAIPTKAAIQDAFENWMSSRVNGSPAPMYFIMVDHGNIDHFYLDNEGISSADIDGWLTTLESNLTANGLVEPRTLIYGACYSGSFIPAISRPGRIIISSSAENEESYKGALESDGIRVGEFFFEEFFKDLGRGDSFYDAFRSATKRTEQFTFRGGLFGFINRFFDKAAQHPLLDDNGDLKGSNEISNNSLDGQVVASMFLGAGLSYDTNSANNPADIAEVMPYTYISDSSSTATLWLKAVDDNEVGLAWAEIRSPDINLSPQGGTEQITLDHVKLVLNFNATNQRWEADFTALNTSGRYELFFFVEDKFTQVVSPLVTSALYKNLAGNTAPGTSTLLEPTDTAETSSVLYFDWSDAIDPEGDALVYNFTLSSDVNFDNIVISQQGLSSSSTYLDINAGLEDQTTYYWKIEAIDIYGLQSISNVFSFTTNNTNAIPAVITGLVANNKTFAKLTGANVVASTGALAVTEFNGQYIIITTPGTVGLTFTLNGYDQLGLSGIETLSGETTTVNVVLNSAVVQDTVDLQVTQVSSNSVITAGDSIVYDVTVTNLGSGIANNVVLTESLPASVMHQTAIPSQGSCNVPVSNTFSCALGNLAPNGSATIQISGLTTTAGDIVNSISALADELDVDISNNSSITNNTVIDFVATVAPVLSQIPDISILQGSTLHLNVIASDLAQYLTDTDSNAADIQYSITNVGSIDTGFQLTIGMDGNGFKLRTDNSIHSHPDSAFTGVTTVTVQAMDESGNLSNPISFTFTVTQVVVDTDADGIPDANDNCPLVSNTDQLDTDNDGSGNVCDSDDDGDGMPDAFENSITGLDSLDASDATTDLDNDGVDNLTEYISGTPVDQAPVTESPVLTILADINLIQPDQFNTNLETIASDADSTLGDLEFQLVNGASIDVGFGISIGNDGFTYKVRVDNQLLIEPASGFTGNTIVTIQVRDESGNESNAISLIVSISENQIPDGSSGVAPVISAIPDISITQPGQFEVDLTQFVTDSDSNLADIQYQIVAGSGIDSGFGISISNDGLDYKIRADNTLMVQPVSGFSGTTVIIIQAQDESANESDITTVTVTISLDQPVSSSSSSSSSSGSGGFISIQMILWMMLFLVLKTVQIRKQVKYKII